MFSPMPKPEPRDRKRDFFSQHWSRGSILLWLSLHFSIWWALSVWYWTSHWDSNWSSAAWHTLIAPAELGLLYLQPHGAWRFGLAGFILSGCLLGLSVLSA